MPFDVNELVTRAARVVESLPRPPRLVILFGSHARGSAHADSDVDLAFLPDGETSLAEELSLEADLTRALDCDVDLVRLDTDDAILKWRVARDGVVVFASPAREAPRFFARAAMEHDEMAPMLEDASRRFARRIAAGRA